MKRFVQVIPPLLAVGLVLGMLWFVYWIIHIFFGYIREVPKEIGASLIAGAATIMVATLTIVIGRYYERKKELDSLHLGKKTEMYDDFLKKLFQVFHGDAERQPAQEPTDIVQALREFTRTLILWSGPEVIESYIKWRNHLAKGTPDAESLFMMEEFLLSVRRDLRHRNRGISKGFFANLIMKNGPLFLKLAKESPKITLSEVEEIEKRLEGPR